MLLLILNVISFWTLEVGVAMQMRMIVEPLPKELVLPSPLHRTKIKGIVIHHIGIVIYVWKIVVF